jgi:hypothetical protein
MTVAEYQRLDIDTKADIVWREGTYLSQVIDYGKYRVNIYELHKFFVGVFYNSKINRIEKIEVLESNKDELLKSISPN